MPGTHERVSGLSGHEIYCLRQVGLRPGPLCVGNSVVALGVGRGLGAGLSTLAGGEVEAVTRWVHEARSQAFARLVAEARGARGQGVTGVSFDVVNHGGNLEFLTLGSAVHGEAPEPGGQPFSSACDGQSLWCMQDAGFVPVQSVFGNVAYSIGIGGSLWGRLAGLQRGEIRTFSAVFDQTRHLALRRLTGEAKAHGASGVVGIQTTLTPLFGTQEMVMLGTAVRHPAWQQAGGPIATSDLTLEETWNLASLGFLPQQLVMGVSVYSLGFAGSLWAALSSLWGGELSGLTEMLYEARAQALARIERDAERCGADEVVGVKTRVYDLGFGLVEFMAMGTAIKRHEGASTRSVSLLPQAIIRDRDTLVEASTGLQLDAGRRASAVRTQRGPLTIFFFVAGVAFYLWLVSRVGS